MLKNTKVHGEGILQEYYRWLLHKEAIHPLCPIVSAVHFATEKISQFVDHFLNPTTFTLKSFVKDTTDFLKKISEVKNLPENSLLAKLDIECLYSNINTQFGLQAAKETLEKTQPNIVRNGTNKEQLSV